MRKTGISCPVCISADIRQFLLRPSVLVHQNLLVDRPERARALQRGELRLICCRSCGFVFNASFDPALVEYGSSYDNCQTCSPLFQNYTEELARHLVYEKGVQGCRVVEVGCGSGTFLRRLVELDGANNFGVGFDPSYVGPDLEADVRLRFERRFYDDKSVDVPADVVVCRHVIEHVPDPVGLLRTIRLALVNSPRARLFFETPCVEWILSRRVVWDFFYEHCSYFTADSLRVAFELAGFGVVDVRHIFGDQYLWLEAIRDPVGRSTGPRPGTVPDLAVAFGDAEPDRIAGWQQCIDDLASQGRVAIWGAGAKGVTFASLVDPDASRFACIVDLNPRKQGRYLPGTGHPIVGHAALRPYGVATALVMNSNYRGEIEALLGLEQAGVRAIDLMELERNAA